MNTSYEQLQHFISNAPWSATDVQKQVAHDAASLFASVRSGETALLLDEFSCRKQGEHSVGVARQYLGCLGKVDNGQVAVLATLSKSIYAAIVATRLFLPESWTTDRKRMNAVGVPDAEQVFQTKPEIAAALTAELQSDGIRWDFLNADALYGNSTAFRRSMDALGEYVVFIHCDQMVYPLRDPKPAVPDRTNERGRAPSLLKTSTFHQRVDELVKEQPASAWQTIEYRTGSKGTYRRQALSLPVWTWDGSEAEAVKEQLVVSRRLDKSDVQYSLSNDRQHKHSLHRLVVRQMHRSWVEQSIRDANQNLGMTEYHVRSWKAWEHHSALTMLAFLFLTQERVANKRGTPLLSCSDIRLALAATMPSNLNTEQAVMNIIKERHRLRARDKERWQRLTASG